MNGAKAISSIVYHLEAWLFHRSQDSVRKSVDGLIPANLSARIPALLAGADMACTILPIVVAQPYFDAVYYFQASTREF